MALPDVTGLRLADLLAAEDTVLANALRRLVDELDADREVIAAFDSYATGGEADGLVPESGADQLP